MKSFELAGKLSLFVLVLAGLAGIIAMKSAAPEPAAPLYEIRSYHIEPAQLDNYKTWISTHGLPHIRKHMDVVGFWVEGDHDAEISGAPMDEMGSANVTWIIKWDSKEARDETMGNVFGTPEWEKIFAKFPGGRDAYKRIEIRYFDGL